MDDLIFGPFDEVAVPSSAKITTAVIDSLRALPDESTLGTTAIGSIIVALLQLEIRVMMLEGDDSAARELHDLYD